MWSFGSYLQLWEKENNVGWEWLLCVWRFPKDFTNYVSPRSSFPRLAKGTCITLLLLCILHILMILHLSGLRRLSTFYTCPKECFLFSVFWWWSSGLRGHWEGPRMPSSLSYSLVQRTWASPSDWGVPTSTPIFKFMYLKLCCTCGVNHG